MPSELRDKERTFALLSALMEEPPERVREAVGAARGRARFQAVRLADDLSFEQLARVESHRYALPGVLTEVHPRREYPYGSLAAHVIGTIGEVRTEQLEMRRFAGYRPGEQVGQIGGRVAARAASARPLRRPQRGGRRRRSHRRGARRGRAALGRARRAHSRRGPAARRGERLARDRRARRSGRGRGGRDRPSQRRRARARVAAEFRSERVPGRHRARRLARPDAGPVEAAAGSRRRRPVSAGLHLQTVRRSDRAAGKGAHAQRRDLLSGQLHVRQPRIPLLEEDGTRNRRSASCDRAVVRRLLLPRRARHRRRPDGGVHAELRFRSADRNRARERARRDQSRAATGSAAVSTSRGWPARPCRSRSARATSA